MISKLLFYRRALVGACFIEAALHGFMQQAVKSDQFCK